MIQCLQKLKGVTSVLEQTICVNKAKKASLEANS